MFSLYRNPSSGFCMRVTLVVQRLKRKFSKSEKVICRYIKEQGPERFLTLLWVLQCKTHLNTSIEFNAWFPQPMMSSIVNVLVFKILLVFKISANSVTIWHLH